jgi:HD-GYP domain-containing protein (c-di-GMP phosphodiesterase class II)
MSSPSRDPRLELVTRFVAVLRTGRAYSVTNEVFRRQVETFRDALRPLLAADGEIALAAFDDGLYINGARLSPRVADFRHYRALLAELERRGLRGLRVLGDAPAAEWQQFFELFLQPERYAGAALVGECRARGLEHVEPALCAATEGTAAGEAGSGAGSGAGGADPAAEGGEAGTAAARGTAGGGSVADPAQAGLPGAAPKRHSQALAGLRSLLTTTSLQNAFELRHVRRVVQPIVDEALDGRPVVIGLAGLSHRDDFTYARNVNACLVAVTVGQRLGLDRQALADLAVGALLHDVGRAGTGDPARVGSEGARRIAAATAFGPSTLRCLGMALFGHGFTSGPRTAAAGGLLARIVAIADAYARLVTHRSPLGRAVTPHQALGMILGPLAPRFDAGLRAALVEALGFFPPGQIVELDDGRIAAVMAPMQDDPAHPIVQLVAGPGGTPLPEGDYWRGGPLPPERAILRALKSDEYPDFEASPGPEAKAA